MDRAIAQYQRAVADDPHAPEPLYDLGNIFLRKGEVDKAIPLYRQALGIDPLDADTHNNLGSALVRQGNLDDAIFHFEAALRIRPGFVPAGKNLGYVAWLLVNRPDVSLHSVTNAVTLAEQADRLAHGEDPVLARTLATAYAQVALFPQALATARRGFTCAVRQHNDALADALRRQIETYQVQATNANRRQD